MGAAVVAREAALEHARQVRRTHAAAVVANGQLDTLVREALVQETCVKPDLRPALATGAHVAGRVLEELPQHEDEPLVVREDLEVEALAQARRHAGSDEQVRVGLDGRGHHLAKRVGADEEVALERLGARVEQCLLNVALDAGELVFDRAQARNDRLDLARAGRARIRVLLEV